jgi:NADPH:quinone reductase-like Zn-dependent oxidoreductase
LSPFASQDLRRYLSVPNHEDLAVLGELVEAGRLHPVIDRIYPLDQTAAALAYIERGHARGKVIIHV